MRNFPLSPSTVNGWRRFIIVSAVCSSVGVKSRMPSPRFAAPSRSTSSLRSSFSVVEHIRNLSTNYGAALGLLLHQVGRPTEAQAKKIDALDPEKNGKLKSIADTCAAVLLEKTESAEVFTQLVRRAQTQKDYRHIDSLADALNSRFPPSEICELARSEDNRDRECARSGRRDVVTDRSGGAAQRPDRLASLELKHRPSRPTFFTSFKSAGFISAGVSIR